MNPRAPMIIHYVNDMDRAKQFYNRVFDITADFESPGWTTLEVGSVTLALHILHPGMDEIAIPNAGLNFLVDSLEEAQERIERNGGRMLELREPDDFVPVRVASFVDSEGNGFELRQEVER